MTTSRTLGAGFAAAILQDSNEAVHLIAMTFSTGVVRLSTGSHDLSWGGFTWSAIGGALELGNVEETADGKGQGVDLSISGVDQTILALLLTSLYRGRPVKIYRAKLDQAAGTVLVDPLLLFQGLQLDPYQVDEERDSRLGGTVKISTRLSGPFGLTRTQGFQTNLASHQHIFAADTFFQNVPSAANTKIYWGTALPRTAHARTP